MKQKLHAVWRRLRLLSKKQWAVVGGLGLVAVWLVVSAHSSDGTPTATVTRGAIIQEVAVSGIVKPVNRIDMGFERGGKIARVFASLGDRVGAGQILAQLEQGELAAELNQELASLASAEAKLQELRRGSRAEDIQIKRTELAEATQDLANAHAEVPNVVSDAYVKAEDAIRQQLDALFNNDEQINPQLSFSVSNSQLKTEVEYARLQASTELNAWKKEMAALSVSAPESVLSGSLKSSYARLIFFRDFLNTMMQTVTQNAALSEATVTTYKDSIDTARTNVSTALSSITTQSQTIANNSLIVQRLTQELNRTLSGTPSEQIAAQEATVKQAEARVQAARAQISKANLVSPIAGIVAKQEAEPGEIVAANTILVTIISDTKLEVEAHVPEIDIAEVVVNNPVRLTFDAFPGDTLMGRVYFIDPAETIIDGVTNFRIKVVLNTNDPRVKSGLTANLAIETKTKENVLTVPNYAVFQNETGYFVRRVDGRSVTEVPVTIGLRGRDGLVEILSGLREGDKILTEAEAE